MDWWRALELLIPTAVSLVLAWTLFRAERASAKKDRKEQHLFGLCQEIDAGAGKLVSSGVQTDLDSYVALRATLQVAALMMKEKDREVAVFLSRTDRWLGLAEGDYTQRVDAIKAKGLRLSESNPAEVAGLASATRSMTIGLVELRHVVRAYAAGVLEPGPFSRVVAALESRISVLEGQATSASDESSAEESDAKSSSKRWP